MKGKARRLLSWVCVLALCMSLLPVTALAAPTESGTQENPVTNTKNQVTVNKWVSQDQDGSYRLNMEAYASDTITSTTTTTPLDIVLVLDTSGSMADSFGEDEGYRYTKVEKTEWSYNDIRNAGNDYFVGVDGRYYEVVAEADGYWENWDWKACDFEIGYYTGKGNYREFQQLGNLSKNDPNETLWTGTLYTREYHDADTKLQAMKSAVNEFIDTVAGESQNTDHRIGIISFASNAGTVNSLTSVRTDSGTLKNNVNDLWANGGTQSDDGLSAAENMLNVVQRNSKKVVILFTDGEPGNYGFDKDVAATAVNTAKELKDNQVTVYTIGVFEDADPSDIIGNFNKYMNAVSSNYPTATAQDWRERPDWDELTLGNEAEGNYYFAATDSDSLTNVFEGIAEDVTTSTLAVYPDKTAILSDTLSEYFDFPADMQTSGNGSDVTVSYVRAKSVNDRTITWEKNPSALPEGLEIKVGVDDGTITITGFDYYANAVTKKVVNGETTYSGGKLVVSFPIELDEAACVADTSITNGQYPTNSIEKDSQAGLEYKENKDAEANNASTLLDKSPTVYYDKESYDANGTDVTVQVYVDGNLAANPYAYVDLSRSSGNPDYTYWEETLDSSGTITCDFDYYTGEGYDCVDIDVTLTNQAYVLQGIQSFQSYGSSGTKNVTPGDDKWTIDNVTAVGNENDPDVKIYLRTKYNVKYYVDSTESQDIVDNTNYISREDVSETSDGNLQGKPNSWMSWHDESLKTNIVLENLPSNTDETTYDGWYLGGLTGDKLESGPAVSEDSDKAAGDQDDNIIKLYAKSSAAEYTVTYQVNGEEPTTSSNVPGDAQYAIGTEVTVADALTTTETSHNGVPGIWTFNGWTTDDVTVTDGVFKMPAQNVEFTGHWTFTEANKVNVTYTVTSTENPPSESISDMPTNTEVYVGSDVTAGSAPTTTSTTNGEVQGTWTFSGWSTENNLMNVQEDVNFTGYWTFTPNTHTITVNVTNGTAKADGLSGGTITVNDNDNVTITFTGNEGYALDTVTVDGSPAVLTTNEDGSTTYTFSNVKADHNISVVYEEDKIGGENPENPGDGTPDKHQATVIYNVENGTFGEEENAPTQLVYVVDTDEYVTEGDNAGTWQSLNKHVDDPECRIPENMTPDSSHVKPGTWGESGPSNTVLLEGNQTYEYTFTFGTEVEKSLSVTKELTQVGGEAYNGSGIVDEGSELTYTITVTNTGNVALTDIVVTDTLTINGVEDEVTLGYNGEDGNVTITDGTATITSLDANASVKLTATYTVPEGTAGQKISNTAVATSGDTTDQPENPVEVTVANPSVEITKALTSATRPGDEGFNYDSTTYKAQVGDQLTYTITVNNTGNTHINVVVTDSLWGNGVNTVYIGGDTTGTSVADGDPVTIAMLPKEDSETITYTYTVQASDIGKQNISNTATASTGTEEDDPKDEDTVTVPMDDYTVTITPANITIYTGGDGYGGVTNESGAIIDGTEASGLPEPGYHIELPAAVVNWLAEQGITASSGTADAVAEDLSKYLTFTYDDNSQTRNWSMDYAGIYATNEDTGEPTRYVYTLNPANVDGEEIPVRLLYKNGEEVVSTDDILMSETLVSDQFSMTINPGELTQSQIRAKLTVEGQSISCNIDIQPGTLTVRSTTDKDTTTEIVNEQGDVTSNTITAVDGGEVQYYVNNSEVTVDANRVQLLVDEVSNGEEFNAAMGADAIAKAGVDRENAAYDLAYMDLVDTQNGNTVVTMDKEDSLTIYWPVPDDAAENSEFHVVHYTDMDRENLVSTEDLSGAAHTSPDASVVDVNGEKYVTFETSSFSPFALVYEKAPDPVAKLEVTKTLTKVNDQPYNNGSVSVNDTLTYTITVKNGGVALDNVTITDTFTGKGDLVFNGYTATENPDGTYTIELGNLEANETVTITATYKVLRADASSDLTNAVKVNGTNPGGGGDPTPGEDTETTPVNPYHPPIRPPVDPDKPELNTEDHYAYIVGYEDGSVQPEGDITRAEVATIFFRLLTDESRNEYWSQTNPYSDVSADDWFNNAVSTLTNAGVLDGYEDGTFKPNGNITRAEFATITARFFEATYDGENLFPDIEGHWAQDYINEAANAGIVNGYEDGTFRPQQYITRAEAVTMVNRTIERHPDADHLLDDMITWPDNPETAWYYEQIQEATNSHEYTMNTDDEQNPYEIWTKLLPNRDWSELEKEWSDANDGAGSGEVV